jgi:hypothetical protein
MYKAEKEGEHETYLIKVNPVLLLKNGLRRRRIMKNAKSTKLIICLLVTALMLLQASESLGLWVNEEIEQQFAQPQDNYEKVLEGDMTGSIVDTINGFDNGTTQISYDVAKNETTISYKGDPMAQGDTLNACFRLDSATYGSGEVHESDLIVREYWTRGTEMIPTPSPWKGTVYHWDTYLLDVSVENHSLDTFTLSDVGYLLTTTPYDLAGLNSTQLPPTVFTDAGLDGIQLLPGASTSFTISAGISQYAVILVDSVFSGASSGNLYTGYHREWLQIQTIPEPATLALLSLGGLALLRRKR